MAYWNYDQFVQVHWDNMGTSHGVPLFLPWHREFTWGFEQALKSIDPSVNLPYWDSSLDSQNPAAADIFLPRYLGGNGQGSQHCVTNGVAGGWNATFPSMADRSRAGLTAPCVSRCFTFSALWNPEAIANTLSNAGSYNSMRVGIEGGPHSAVHVQIGGGTCGDMGTMASTNDPIFFLHHSFVDKMWSRWQSACPKFKTAYDGGRLDDGMAPWGTSIGSTLDTVGDKYCYIYAQSPGDVTIKVNCAADSTTTASAPAAEATLAVNDWFAMAIRALVPGTSSSVSKLLHKRAIPADYYNSTNDATSVFVTATNSATESTATSSAIEPTKSATATSALHALPTYSPAPGLRIVAPPLEDNSDMIHLRHPPTCPKAWLHMNNLDPYTVRQIEISAKDRVDELNNMGGYVSKAALQYFPIFNPENGGKHKCVRRK